MRILLVDAHSVIFASRELRALHERHMESAREGLISQLANYQDVTGTRVVVVFDGKGAKAHEEKRPGSVQIFFSGKKGGADAVIERLVAKYSGIHEMTVSTNDHLVRQTVITFGGMAMSVDGLMEELRIAGADLARKIRKLRQQ